MRRTRSKIYGDRDKMVECHFLGTVTHIPEELFFSVLMGRPLVEKKFVRYRDGAKMYAMCQSEFNILAHDAEAIYKRNKMALVNIEILDNFLEFFHEV